MAALHCDVLVVGAGPAGSSAARAAAAAGASVIFIEKRARIGAPVQCAEWVPRSILSRLPRSARVVVQDIRAMRSHLPGQPPVVTPAPGAIIDRGRFDRALAEAACAAGARLLAGTRAVALSDRTLVVERAGERSGILARTLIAADGPRSRMRAWTGGGQPRFVQALQHRMPLVAPLHTTECFLRRSIPGGYGWVFPRGPVANVGVGVDPALGVRALDAHRVFVQELLGLGVVHEQVLERTGGVLPVSGLLALRRGRVLFAGDAAGQCHPITGAGIASALICGELAGAAAAEAALQGDLGALDEYVEEVTELLGPSLDLGVARRALQLATWGDPERWAATLRRSWVAFDDYHRRPRMETTQCPA